MKELKVDPDNLARYGLDINQLGQMISMNNQNMPGGVVDKASRELTIRLANEFRSIEELKAMPIPLRTGDSIQLEDLAQVAEKLNEEIEKIKSENPDLNIKVILDSSEFIKLSIDNVVKNVLLGSVLAVVILFCFS